MMEERWEYRVWTEPDAMAAAIRRELKEKDADYRTDTYLLTGGGRDLIKLRGGETLEVKQLLAADGTLEYWGMAWRQNFPMDLPSELAGHDLTAENEAELRRAVSAAGIPMIDVRKHRRRYEADGACLEVTAVIAEESRHDTLGIEAPELDVAKELASRFGFDRYPNVHYGAFLRSLFD
ncbi:MAG: hypothetical protein V2I43_21495 [Parvularcula sp.]|jgi:hypothetical protein|nr:hypothetical protein [Parvularcula sp.]